MQFLCCALSYSSFLHAQVEKWDELNVQSKIARYLAKNDFVTSFNHSQMFQKHSVPELDIQHLKRNNIFICQSLSYFFLRVISDQTVQKMLQSFSQKT